MQFMHGSLNVYLFTFGWMGRRGLIVNGCLGLAKKAVEMNFAKMGTFLGRSCLESFVTSKCCETLIFDRDTVGPFGL